MNPRRRHVALLVCLALLGLHLLLVVVRIPTRVYARRAVEIAEYESRGAAGYLLGNARLGGAGVIAWLQQHVPAEHAVLWEGETKGPFEVLAACLAPRMLVDAAHVPADAATVELGGAARPLARAELPDGRRGTLVVAACRDRLELTVR